MKIQANGKDIQIEESVIRALLNNDLDTAGKHGLMGVFYLVAEAFGISDAQGNEIPKREKIKAKDYIKAFNNQMILSETPQVLEFIASKMTIRTIIHEGIIEITYTGRDAFNGDPIYTTDNAKAFDLPDSPKF